jgi:hypothetical protein
VSYQPSVPTGTVPFNQDYLNIQGNFSTLNNLYSVDHVPLNNNVGTPPDGYHKAIHLVPQGIPAAVSNYGELYAQTLNDGQATGQQLWYQFKNGADPTINFPLTRNIQPLVAATGYTFLPGGIILQWGIGNTVGGVLTFPTPFSAATFQPVVTYATAQSPTPRFVTSDRFGFTIDRAAVGLSWMAIGT